MTQPPRRPRPNPFSSADAPKPIGGKPHPDKAKRDAARQLGATDDEIAASSAEDLTRISRSDAARLLGEMSYMDRIKAGRVLDLRPPMLMRFRTVDGRRWLVRTLETELTGRETTLPKAVIEAVEHRVVFDRTKTPDAPHLQSVNHAKRAYEALAAELGFRQT